MSVLDHVHNTLLLFIYFLFIFVAYTLFIKYPTHHTRLDFVIYSQFSALCYYRRPTIYSLMGSSAAVLTDEPIMTNLPSVSIPWLSTSPSSHLPHLLFSVQDPAIF